MTSFVSTYPPFQREYISGNQVITIAGALTLAHGFGSIPELQRVEIVCVTAEAGYVAGDVAAYYPGLSAGQRVSVVSDATNINIRFGNDGQVFYLPNKTTGAGSSLTNGNWAFRVKAWV